MKRKVFITIAIAMILASASVSTAQPNNRIPTSQLSKSVPALSEEQIKSLIQAETEKKDALRGQAEAERKFDTTMVWVQVLLGGVSLLLAFVTIVPVSLGVLFWIFRKSIFGQLNAEAKEEVAKQVEEHIKPIIDTEIQTQISALIEKKLNQRIQEFEAAVPASTQEIPSPEKLSQIEELRRRIEDLQDLMPTMMMQSAEYYIKQGNAFYFEKRYEEAISSYDKALGFKPDDSEVWSNRGVMLGELKRYEEAIMSFSKAIEFELDNSITWSNRGIALGYLKRYEEAISSYDNALKFKPDDSEVWSNRGVMLGELKRYEEAILSYDNALKFRPDNSHAWSNRGIALGYLKRYEEALTSHNKALEFKPDFPEAFYNRACCYALQGKIAETVHDLKRAIELDSTYREQAKTESDFNEVRHDEEFQKLLNGEL
jgi:Flp pilus assembly protein TadD